MMLRLLAGLFAFVLAVLIGSAAQTAAQTASSAGVKAPAASRAVIAAPTPSPALVPLSRTPVVNQALRASEIKDIVTQRLGAISRLPARTFAAPRLASAGVGMQDLHITSRPPVALAQQLDYCAQHPPEVDRVSGNVTPGGTLTIGGICFGTSGTARISGNFPNEPGGVGLLIQSWTDTQVQAQLFGQLRGASYDVHTDSFSGSLDQPVDLQIVTRRTAGKLVVVGPGTASAPVRLQYTARRMTSTAPLGSASCAIGEPLEPQRPDFCGEYGWGSFKCDVGNCFETYHARKSPASGEDVYSISLSRGFVLNTVMLFGEGADIVFDPSLDPSHVTFRVRWRTLHKSDPDLVKNGHPEYADYNDGSYLFLPITTGPDGVRP
jgi:hypothetical protein